MYKKQQCFCGERPIFGAREIAQNRSREQGFDVLRISAEMKAGSARFFQVAGCFLADVGYNKGRKMRLIEGFLSGALPCAGNSVNPSIGRIAHRKTAEVHNEETV